MSKTAKDIQAAIYEDYAADQLRKLDTHVKKSFWASDCLKPINELFWAWTHVPKTNPPSPEKLSMFDVCKLCELHTINRLVKAGIAADLDNPEHIATVEAAIGKGLAFADEPDEFGKKQIKMEMERAFCPWSGYLDGITLNGEPIEIKSTRSDKYIRDIATGRPPQIEHVYQLATYMDFMRADRGWLIVVSRSDGVIMIVKVETQGDLVFTVTDYSMGLPEEMRTDDEFVGPIEPETLVIDLQKEYERMRRLFEDYIHPLREPPLEYEYRPDITKELLDGYPEDKIKLAIKGKRMLSSHGWKPQYCDWRDLWIQTEMEQKGASDPKEFLSYTNAEVQSMLDYLDAELVDGSVRKITENRRKQIEQEKRDARRKAYPSFITDQRRKNGVEDTTEIASILPASLSKKLLNGLDAKEVCDLDSVTDGELLQIEGLGKAGIDKIRGLTFTFDPPDWFE